MDSLTGELSCIPPCDGGMQVSSKGRRFSGDLKPSQSRTAPVVLPGRPGRAMPIRDSVVAALREAADPERAPQQQAYMKSEMPFFGVGVPQCRRIANAVFRAHPLPDTGAWEAAILELWRNAAHREERYAAVELLLFRRYARWLEPARVPLIEEMVVTGAWWDYVDAIAGRGVGTMLAAHPRPTKAVLREWARDDDIWKRRTAILAQLKAKGATDTKLLADTIRPSIGEAAFFLRKGIGWALREYSKTDPGWVLEFVGAHPGLSDLSRREALKHLERTNALAPPPSTSQSRV